MTGVEFQIRATRTSRGSGKSLKDVHKEIRDFYPVGYYGTVLSVTSDID